MQYFNFQRLIRKYMREMKLIIYSKGEYNNSGDYVKGEKQEVSIYGAVISFKESKIHRSEGNLTQKDKRLFTLEPIDNALKGSQMVFGSDLYNIEDSNTENAVFTGVYAYTLKYNSAIKEDRE